MRLKDSIHGQAFYSTGDDDAGDDDIKQFVIIDNPDYYWSEIMGLGIFDEQVPTNCPADEISNVWAVNIGAGYKATEKLKFTGDLCCVQPGSKVRLASDDFHHSSALSPDSKPVSPFPGAIIQQFLPLIDAHNAVAAPLQWMLPLFYGQFDRRLDHLVNHPSFIKKLRLSLILLHHNPNPPGLPVEPSLP